MEKLIEKAITGDKEAYVKLIDSIKSDLYRVAQARLTNIDDVNDAIHETILKSFKNLNRLKTTSYFKTWIIKILINECNNIYKSNNKQFWIFNKLSDSKTNHITKNTLQDIEDNFDFELLLKNLNYDERIVVILYFNNRFSTYEIADILNISANTVKSRLTRAKEKIKKSCKGGMKL